MVNVVYTKDFLAHHGIKGQKWGQRNGPPYPLKESNRSRSEKKFQLSSKDRINKAIEKYGSMTSSELRNLGGYVNPNGDPRINNCKECAEATIKRWLQVDVGAVASTQPSDGNLRKFVEERNYDSSGVTWIGGDNDISLQGATNFEDRISKAILRKCKNGDCGMIGVEWDFDKKFAGYDKNYIEEIKRLVDEGRIPPGHAFNFYVKGDKVIYYDDQPDSVIGDASSYLTQIRSDKNPEAVRLTRKAFAN